MIKVLWTPRFDSNLKRYSGLQNLVAKKTFELTRKAEAMPNTWHFELEKMKDDSFGNLNFFKVAITAGDRMIFLVNEGSIILCDIGKHEVMDEYASLSRAVRDSDIAKALQPLPWFKSYLSMKFEKDRPKLVAQDSISNSENLDISVSLPGEERWLHEEELSAAWVSYLDQEQAVVSSKLLELIEAPKHSFEVYFVLGGPGTGKTVVLLNLAINLKNKGLSVSFEMAPQVLKYLNSGDQTVPGANLGLGPGVTILIDDPGSPDQLATRLRHAKTSKVRCVVVALDPLQWHQTSAVLKFEQIYRDYSSQLFSLWNCYRQARNVGKRAIEIVQSLYSSDNEERLSPKKQVELRDARKYLDLSLGMEFKDTTGRFMVYDLPWDSKHIINETDRIRARYDLWKHFHPICIVFHDSIPANIKGEFINATQGLNRRDISMSKYEDIRGLEFQELILVVPNYYWSNLQNAIATQEIRQIAEFSCLHTILSRPKDSLMIFVTE